MEEERKEGSGVASTLDWNLKIPGSIPGSTLREIIHPKTTLSKSENLNGLALTKIVLQCGAFGVWINTNKHTEIE